MTGRRAEFAGWIENDTVTEGTTMQRAMTPWIVLALSATCALAVVRTEGPLPPVDVRDSGDRGERPGVMRSPTLAQHAAAAALDAEFPGSTLRWNVRAGSPKWMAAPAGTFFSGPSDLGPESAARAFFDARTDLFGLSRTRLRELRLSSVVPAPDGGAHVHFSQEIAGLEVFQSHAVVNVAAGGAVRSAGTTLFAGLRPAEGPSIVARDALVVALRHTYPQLPIPAELPRDDGAADTRADRLATFHEDGFAEPPTARLVLFPTADRARLAWRVHLAEPSRFTDYVTLVDAHDGSLLFRRNRTRYATARVLDGPVPVPFTEEFAPDNHVLVNVPDAATPTAESPEGYIDGDGTTLAGNNARSRPGYLGLPPATDPSASWDAPFGGLDAALVQAWYVTNEIHDHLRALGFDEPRGAFQDRNFGLGGVEGDAIDVVAFDAGGRNNAFYGGGATDGEEASITFLWSSCPQCADHDGLPETGGERHVGFAGDVVVHEYVHGATTRLLGGPLIACEIGIQGTAMDEGWSDYFAESYYDEPRLGAYFVDRRGFLRTALNDVDYRDLCSVDDRCGSHADGMIWQATAWDLREALRSLDPAGGVETADRLLLESLATSACFPSFVDARDAILDADVAMFGGAHRDVIWNVFAARGLGQGAFSLGPDDPAPTADFTVPFTSTCIAPAAPASLTATPEGANAIRLNYTTAGASAIEIRRDDLDHPFDTMTRLAYTTDTATFVDDTVQAGKSYRYEVVPLGAVGPLCAGGASPTADAVATGTCTPGFPLFDAAVTVADESDCSVTLSWLAASPSCPGSGDPIVYNVHRASRPGFEPSSRTLVGRTTATTWNDTPPDDARTAYYAITAEHGTLVDAPDHRERGTTHLARWTPALPATGKLTASSWSFDAGPAGWTVDNTTDPSGGWTLVDPTPTRFGGALLAPDEASGGTGQAWVTGDPGTAVRVNEADSDGSPVLTSPMFDATGGATLLSFDYWSHDGTVFSAAGVGLSIVVDNGSTTVETPVIGGMTVQAFETAGRHGWQRAAVDLATLIAPTATMQVSFRPFTVTSIAEFGIDEVRVESGTTCSRSSLVVDALSVDDSNPGGGNGNGSVEPGETVFLDLTVANDGSATAFAPEVTVSSPTPGVTIHDAVATFADLAPGAQAASSDLSITVSLAADCEAAFSLDFTLRDAAGTTAYETIALEAGFAVTELLLEDTFETDKGWTAENDPGAGFGRWERADPVGTLDGGTQANPEDDSPNDAGTMCYVTENGAPGADPDAHDLDVGYLALHSPPLDLRPYKRARMFADVWYYDDTESADVFEDFVQIVYSIDDELFAAGKSGVIEFLPSSLPAWTPYEFPIAIPRTDGMRIGIRATDHDENDQLGATEGTVEAGLDNVRIEGDRQTCNPSGVDDPPGAVTTLRVDRAATDVVRSWTAPPTDPTRDGAAYYRVFVSSSPDAGFVEEGTTATTSSSRSLATAGPVEFYSVTAVNEAGDSDDVPAP